MRRLIPLLFFLLGTACLAWGAANQSHADILDAVRNYLETQLVQPGSDYQIDISPIDPRVQLSQCPVPLEAFSMNDKRRSGLLTIGVRCQATSNPWTIYTRAKLGLSQTVLVLRESVAQGTTLNSTHLDLISRDVTDLHNSYFTKPEQVIGKSTKRNLTAGTILSSNVLVTLKIIKRGDTVAIRLRNELLDVQMSGTALTDAELGQRVQVRNENSKRIIEGIAVAPGIVEVE